MKDQFSVAQWKSMASGLGVDLKVTTDSLGRQDIQLDRTAMVAFRDAADRLGFPDIADVFQKALNSRGES